MNNNIMKYLFFLLLITMSLTATAQNYPDSLSAEVITVNDSTFKVQTFVMFEGPNGEKTSSTITSEYLDSTGVARYILRADLRGLRSGRIRVSGRKQVAELAREFFITSKAVGEVYPNLFQSFTGIDTDKIDIGLDGIYVGDWQFRETGDPTLTEFIIIRRPNGRFAAVTEESGTKCFAYSKDEIGIRNFGTLETGILSFYRMQEGRDVFTSIDGKYIIRKLYTQ